MHAVMRKGRSNHYKAESDRTVRAAGSGNDPGMQPRLLPDDVAIYYGHHASLQRRMLTGIRDRGESTVEYGGVVQRSAVPTDNSVGTMIPVPEQEENDASMTPRQVGVEGSSRHGYSVDPAMFSGDEAAGVLRDGEYVKNPTAHKINDDIRTAPTYLGSKRMNGQYMYVVDMDGNIVIGTRSGQRMPHPTLIGGRNPQVQAAGILEIRRGKIYSINNASGHFKPSDECLAVAEEAFGNLPPEIFSQNFVGYLSYGQ